MGGLHSPEHSAEGGYYIPEETRLVGLMILFPLLGILQTFSMARLRIVGVKCCYSFSGSVMEPYAATQYRH
jgi:hypothetical protein